MENRQIVICGVGPQKCRKFVDLRFAALICGPPTLKVQLELLNEINAQRIFYHSTTVIISSFNFLIPKPWRKLEEENNGYAIFKGTVL